MLEFQAEQPGSVSREIEGVKQDDPQAFQELWNRCFEQLRRIARRRLVDHPRGIVDSEDLAADVFASLCRGIEVDRWPQLESREDLWKILFTLTRHKAIDLLRTANTEKHGGGMIRQWPNEVAADGPGPEDLALLDDQYQYLLRKLPDVTFRKVAQLKIELCTVAEISEILHLATRTVERKLSLIRTIWADLLEESKP